MVATPKGKGTSDSAKYNLGNLILAGIEATYAECVYTNCPLCGTGTYSKQQDVDDSVPS